MHVTIRGFGEGIAVAPSPLEAFALPCAWAMLFGAVGILVGLYGRRSRKEAARILGAGAAPLSLTLRVAVVALAACAIVTAVGAFALFGEETRALALGSVTGALGTAFIVFPTLVATVFLAAFGVSSDWSMSALSQGHGSVSAFGGVLPSTAAHPAGSVPGVLALLPLIGLAITVALGWFAARRGGTDVRLGLASALRAAALLTGLAWLLGLLAHVDVQVGGLLGFHFAPDAESLLWHVPLLAFLGAGLGATARTLAAGAGSRRALGEVLVEAANAARAGLGGGRLDPARHGILGRATTGLAFAAVPATVLVMGPVGSAGRTPTPPKLNFAPIARSAEAELEEDSTGAVRVAVNPSPGCSAAPTSTSRSPPRARPPPNRRRRRPARSSPSTAKCSGSAPNPGNWATRR